LVVIVIFLRLRAQSATFDWSAFAATFARLDWLWLLLSCAVALASYYARALRWAVFLEPLRPQASIWNLLKATMIGFTAVTLLGRPGEIVRPYLISVKEKVPLSSQLAMWVLERIFDLLFALLIFGFGLNRVLSSQVHVGPALQWTFRIGGGAVWVMSGICLVLLVLLRQYPSVFRERLMDSLAFLPDHRRVRLEKTIVSFLEGVESLRGIRSLLLAIGYSGLNWILIAACYFCVIRSFHGFFEFGLIDVFIYMGFVSFGAVVQLPGIGGGMQVVSVLVLHEIFSVPVEIASSVALITWATTFVTILPIGILLAFHEGLNWRSLKAIKEESAL